MAGAERTLTQRELNRALLARQLLLERGTGSLPKTLDRIGGIQAQYAPSMYVGLWSRLEGFERDQLTRALERRTVVQGTLMRQTIHLVSAGDYWPLALAVRDARRASWLKSHRGSPTARDMEAAAKRIRGPLRKGPLPRKELEEVLGTGWGAMNVLVNGVGMWIDLLRAPPSGTWERRRADIYASAEAWLGAPKVKQRDAVDHIIRRYLGGFGPASGNDIADWTGLPKGDVASALGRLRLRRFREERGGELVDLARAPLPDPDTPAPVRFLPTWDATLLVHARRTQILPEELRPRVFSTRTPQSVSTFLVDGAVAGTWRYDKGRVKVEPFRRLDRAARRELDEEGERLAALHA